MAAAKENRELAPSQPDTEPETCEKKDADAGYCTAATLAKFLGKSETWIAELCKKGVVKKHRRGSKMLFNFLESVRAYIVYIEERAKAREGDTADQEKAKLEAEVKFKNARGEMADLELQEFKGKLHRSEDVEAMTEDLVYNVRGALEALPGRVAVDAAAAGTAKEVEVIIRKEVHLVEAELANYRYDSKKYTDRVRERQKWDELDAEE